MVESGSEKKDLMRYERKSSDGIIFSWCWEEVKRRKKNRLITISKKKKKPLVTALLHRVVPKDHVLSQATEVVPSRSSSAALCRTV